MAKAMVTAFLVALTAACSSGSGGGSPSLTGTTWEYANSAGTAGEGVVFNTNGTYALLVLQLTSSSSGNVQEETGTYVVSGNTITVTPKEWTCPGPDPVYSATYSFQGSSLAITEPSGVVIFQPDDQMASMAALTHGCFSSSGAFTAMPLASVSN